MSPPPPGRSNLSKTRFWVQLQKFIDIFHLFVPTTRSLSHCLGLKGLTWDLYYAVCWGRLHSIWQVASSPCQGEEKAPCLCGIHGLSPRGLAILISPAETSELPSQSFTGSAAGQGQREFCFVFWDSLHHDHVPPTHTCTHTSNTCPGPKPRPLCELLGPRAPLLQMTAARCELPRQRYWKGYCCVFRERRQLYGSLQVDSALESGGCQSRGSRQL